MARYDVRDKDRRAVMDAMVTFICQHYSGKSKYDVMSGTMLGLAGHCGMQSVHSFYRKYLFNDEAAKGGSDD
uniref:Uncharacterized protein n=1 Tax=Candidatus Kentrum sp. LFY TaxID=2126342 RepID=A0A450WGV4_9GAMM|nr:MAG: hypothetical protein BECKLFY1418C_GA0070996_102230 [Candidatus Kentron sp. LFY]